MDNLNATLVVEDLHKYFGSDEVLKGISLEAYEGDVIAMMGASGSGKSTFLRCINLLETPTSGEIYVRGELIRMKKNNSGVIVPENIKQVERIRTRLGMVFQQFNLWYLALRNTSMAIGRLPSYGAGRDWVQSSFAGDR